MHGASIVGRRPMSANICVALSYQCFALRFNPYSVLVSNQYVLVKSSCFSMRRWWIASMDIVRRSMRERTGAYVSDLDQVCWSRLPNTTMRYFARFGFPASSNLIVDMAIVGKARPVLCRNFLYSSYVIVIQDGRSFKPKYSSLYAASQVFLSDDLSSLC